MTTYNGVTFTVLAEDSMFWPTWENEGNVSVRHIPGGRNDDIQFGGRGFARVSLKAHVTSDADMATLRGSLDGTARTLGDLRGGNYTNTYLTKISNLRRWDGGETWTCEMEFMRDDA